MFEPETADLRRVIDKPGSFRLTKPLSYYCQDGWIITAPELFESDLASIPRIFRPLFRVNGRHSDAAIIHDYIYHKKGHVALRIFTREQADQIFYEAMLDSRVPKWKASLMWLAVRAGGWLFWYSSSNHG